VSLYAPPGSNHCGGRKFDKTVTFSLLGHDNPELRAR
jgi:hypothetical protein